jgi:predicted peptidase
MEQLASAALDQSIREFHGDRRRLVLTGISMGGTGAWYMARHRRRFAAVVPVSGAIVRRQPFPTDPPPDVARIAYAFDPYAVLAEEIGPRLPVWAFHAANDDVIAPSETRNMVAALQRLGSNVRYTEYPDNAWDRAYADPNLVKWMLAQKTR